MTAFGDLFSCVVSSDQTNSGHQAWWQHFYLVGRLSGADLHPLITVWSLELNSLFLEIGLFSVLYPSCRCDESLCVCTLPWPQWGFLYVHA